MKNIMSQTSINVAIGVIYEVGVGVKRRCISHTVPRCFWLRRSL